MSYADQVFMQNIREILDHGVWDTDQNVRPHWEDGTPAHTIKKFGIVNRYDLQKEFPILTLRRTYWKTAVDELLWIWQKKSNNVHDLNARIWDQWADETGSIGKAYGYQLAVKSLLFQLLYDISCHELWKERKKPSASRDRMKQLLGYIEEHYGEKITIQQAASLCGYSSSHCQS